MNPEVIFVAVVVSVTWLVLLIEVALHYRKKAKKNKPTKETVIDKVVSVVDTSEKYKDVIREILPHTLKGKKATIKKILDKHNISYVWD